MTEKTFVSTSQVMTASRALVDQFAITSKDRIWGVPRGGCPVALLVCALSGATLVDTPDNATILVDDIYDSGRTRALYQDKNFAVLFDKRTPPWSNQWLVMPWEGAEGGRDASAEDAVVRLLQFIGEDVTREGLRETPSRVIKAWQEWASGYNKNPAEILKTFEDGATNELVIVHNIPVVSKCEHHLADITGIAHVGYIPNGRIVGLSKLPRLVEVFTRRLQVQERLTSQIADTLMECLEPIGVGVLIRASHSCMSGRGVRIHGSITTTSAVRGALLHKPEARAEFLSLCRDAEQYK